ncbi:MAG: alpha-hydroxy acid oxidase [Nannocystaceae bacterium]
MSHDRDRGESLHGITDLDAVSNLLQLEPLARRVLPPEVFAYIAGGACDERTLEGARESYDRIVLRPRVLVDVSRRERASTLLGSALANPWLVAPTAMHGLVHRHAELATAAAAREAGSIMVLSSLSTTPVVAVAAQPPARCGSTAASIAIAARPANWLHALAQAGARALVVTVDAPVLGLRERDRAHGVALPPGFRAPNVRADGDSPAEALGSYFASLVDPALSWRDLAWLRAQTELPIVLKGVLRADDAARAVAEGVAGVVVSTHGGRQLDGAIATIDAVPEIADAVAERALVLLDGGIRRGTDVIKALARGADAVLLGRPVLWGLALGGQRGVAKVFALLERELDVAMALCGCARLDDIDASLLR